MVIPGEAKEKQPEGSQSETKEVQYINLVGNVEPFQPGANFKGYCDRMSQYFNINRIQEEKKTAFFITMCGTDTYEILMSLSIPRLPSELKYSEIIALLNNYFDPKRNKRAERYKFNKCEQENGETIGDFIVRLKSLAQFCEFGDVIPNGTKVPDSNPNVGAAELKLTVLTEALADRFIIGLKNEKIQQVLLNNPSWSFDQYVEKALNMEMVEKEQKSISNLHQNAVFSRSKDENNKGQAKNFQKQYRKRDWSKNTSQISQNNNFSKSTNKNKCKSCGRNHNEENCPAKNWECFKCHKKGHTSVVCKEKGQSSVSMIYGISNGNESVKCILDVEGQKLEMEVDTGACASIISQTEYQNKFSKNKLAYNKNTNYNLLTVVGNQIKVEGKLDVRVSHTGRDFNLPLIIVAGSYPGRPIMGRNWLDRIFPNWRTWYGCNTISQVNLNTSFVELVKTKYPKIVEKELSAPIQDFKVDLVLKENKVPKFCAAYSVPYNLKEKVEEEIRRLCKEGILVPIKYSKYASPIVVVPKSNGSIRLCIDGKVNLNECLEMQHYPLPLAEDIIVEMQGCEYFSVIDMTGAYLQVLVSEESQKYLVVNTSLGLFAFTRLPFGISIASSAFQSILDQILKNLKGVKAYQDDIIIGAKTVDELKKKVCQVLDKLSYHNVKINLDKCKLMVDSVNYLGFNLSKEGIKPNNEKIRAIMEAPVPKNVTQLQAYLGLINFYRKFIPNLSSELHSLYELLRKNVKFDWNKESQDAFEKSKKLISSKSVLEIYDHKKEIIVATDASPHGVAGCLAHVVNGIEKPVMFASSTLSPAEKNYSQLHREALAIVYAIRKFSKYLFGRSFTIVTDSSVIKEIFSPGKSTTAVAAARLQRWSVELSMYHYKIKHRSAKNMSHVDALSRLPLSESTGVEYFSINFFNKSGEQPVDIEVVRKAMCEDKGLRDVYNFTKFGWPSKVIPSLELFYRKRNFLSTENDCLYYGSRLVIPEKLRNNMLSTIHESHMGIVKMKMLARSYVWWPNCDRDIEQYVNSCIVCQKTRDNVSSKVQDSKWSPAKYPFERIHIDFFDFAGKKYLLVVDAFSKFIDIKVMNSTTAIKVIDQLMKIFSIFGYPKFLVSDNGPPFGSHIFIKFCKLNGITVFKSPPYHPESNGLAERAVRTVKGIFKKYCIAHPSLSTEEKTNKFLLYYRNTPCTTNGRTPSSILFAFKPKIVLDLIKNNSNTSKIIVKNYKNIKEKVMINTDKSKIVKNEFSKNDNVMYLNHVKDFVKWVPAKIAKVISNLRYLIITGGQVRYVHRNQIRKSNLSDKFHVTDGKLTKYNNDSNTFQNAQSEKIFDEEEQVTSRPKRKIKPPQRFSHSTYMHKNKMRRIK